MKDLKKILILAGCLVLVLAISLVGCFGGRDAAMQCQCDENCVPECVCECEVAVFAPVGERDNAAVAVIGSNAALANIGIDMAQNFLNALDKTADFNEIHDRDVLRALKSGGVDVVISFEPRTNDREIMWMTMIDSDSETFYIAVRRDDTEFISSFEDFVNEYYTSGALERSARQHMANYRDFLSKVNPPFSFAR